MKQNRNITIFELTKKLKTSRITILRRIKKLKDIGLITRIGSDKKGYWKILK